MEGIPFKEMCVSKSAFTINIALHLKLFGYQTMFTISEPGACRIPAFVTKGQPNASIVALSSLKPCTF